MNNIEEKRDAARIEVSCEICCKLVATNESHSALCITLSGSGISFISEYPFEIGAVVEVSIVPETALISALKFMVIIARCRAIENGQFDIGARIQLPDEID